MFIYDLFNDALCSLDNTVFIHSFIHSFIYLHSMDIYMARKPVDIEIVNNKQDKSRQ
jgi:hypothetical protein